MTSINGVVSYTIYVKNTYLNPKKYRSYPNFTSTQAQIIELTAQHAKNNSKMTYICVFFPFQIQISLVQSPA